MPRQLGSPYFCKPLARLFNVYISTSEIPSMETSICPVPKVPVPQKHADFRPISITSVLTRSMKRIVSDFIYPSLSHTTGDSVFRDYTFRPFGSTTAAIICILQSVTALLDTDPYVSVIALDFSKAFDIVRHYTLLQKMPQLDIPDCMISKLFLWTLTLYKIQY